MTFNLHQVKKVKILPPASRDITVWQNLVIEFEYGTFELNLFPADSESLPLLVPTEPSEQTK